jgi:hypothetical protein
MTTTKPKRPKGIDKHAWEIIWQEHSRLVKIHGYSLSLISDDLQCALLYQWAVNLTVIESWSAAGEMQKFVDAWRAYSTALFCPSEAEA